MNRRTELLFLVSIIIAGLALTGCEQPEPEVEEPVEVEEEPEPEPVVEEEEEMEMELAEPSEQAAELIAAIEGYEQWEHHEGMDEPYESGHPGDVWVIPYANEVGHQAVADQQLPIPEGAIFVKEEYADADGEELTGVTVMEKLSEEMGDWYWLKTDPELQGVMEMEGMALEGPDVEGCVNCHGEASGQDYLMLPEFE